MRQIVLYQDEDGVWIADVPSLPGCHSDGATRDEAFENAKEAIALYIESLIARGEAIPEDRQTAEIVQY